MFDERIDYIAHVIMLPSVLSIGLVNQCLNVITLSHIPYPSFSYLEASAIADILSIFALIPFIVRHAGLNDEHSHMAMWYHAHLELPLVNALMCAGALCIVAMTIDRYLSICHPIASFKSSESRYNIRSIIAVLYALSFIVFVPSGWQKLSKATVDANNRTVWRMVRNSDVNNTREFRAYLMFRECFAKLCPIVILVVLNSAIMHTLRKISAKRQSFKRRQKATKRVSILLLITSTTFVLCTLPASLLSLFMDHFNNNSMEMQIFRAVANLLQATTYLYNFYLYALCSSEYRRALLQWMGFSEKEPSVRSSESRSIRCSAANHNKLPSKRYRMDTL